MRARLRDTEIYFDVVGAGLVADGERMRERPVAFVIHGGPGNDHSDLKAAFSPLSETMQLVLLRSPRAGPLGARRCRALCARRECRGHGGLAPPSRAWAGRQHRH